MEDKATLDERLRAYMLAHRFMLVKLWTAVVPLLPEGKAHFDAIERSTMDEMERLLAHVGGRDAAITRHLALSEMETIWATVRHEAAIPKTPKADAAPERKRRGRGPKTP